MNFSDVAALACGAKHDLDVALILIDFGDGIDLSAAEIADRIGVALQYHGIRRNFVGEYVLLHSQRRPQCVVGPWDVFKAVRIYQRDIEDVKRYREARSGRTGFIFNGDHFECAGRKESLARPGQTLGVSYLLPEFQSGGGDDTIGRDAFIAGYGRFRREGTAGGLAPIETGRPEIGQKGRAFVSIVPQRHIGGTRALRFALLLRIQTKPEFRCTEV